MIVPVRSQETTVRWRTDGKFFRTGDARVRFRAVTFGPFPGGLLEMARRDFRRIAAAGFDAVRLFSMPGNDVLDQAQEAGLKIFAGLDWAQNGDFFREPGRFTAARVRLAECLRETAKHPALAGVYVGNEIPADLVRWMGPAKVRRALETLIAEGREAAPHLLFAYANYPTTEYLEPENADFTAFNVYLETEESFRAYVKRLHHIAGDRPLVISEFGLDTRRNGCAKQAEVFSWAARTAEEGDAAGFTAYAWSDLWWNRQRIEPDWDFGLTDREGNAKEALGVFSNRTAETAPDLGDFSVIVCSHDGRERIDACLAAIRAMDGTGFETILVDDGSADGMADHVETNHPWVKVLRLEPCGLSAARNAGAAAAKGKFLAYTDDDCEPDRGWLAGLARCFASGWDAAGGPNLPPPPRGREQAVIAAAPGAPSHVMLNDDEAEHLPGCNLAVARAAFEAVGGFDPRFRTAGDDVDFCWRLRDAGLRLGFAPGAFVWHHRRATVGGYLRQQLGYGKAEKLLMAKFPARFSPAGGAKWEGFVYGGGPVRVRGGSVIYYGPAGGAPYQHVVDRMLPLRGLAAPWNDWRGRLMLHVIGFLVPLARAWARGTILPTWPDITLTERSPQAEESVFPGKSRADVLKKYRADGWRDAEDPAWDLEKGNARLLTATEWFEDGSCRTLARLTES